MIDLRGNVSGARPESSLLLIAALCVAAFLFLGMIDASHASSTVATVPGTGRYPLGLHLDLLEDRAGALGIDQARSPEFDRQWIPSTAEVPNLGFTRSTYWARFKIKPGLHTENMFIEVCYPLLDYITLYAFDANGTLISEKKSGDFLPYRDRELKYKNFLFEIDPQKASTYYMRVKTDSSMQLPLVLWEKNEFLQRANTELTLWGGYFGILLIMVFYNLFIFFSVRDRVYLYYVLYISCAILTQASLHGFTAEYLLKDSPLWVNRSFPLALNSALFCGNVFCNRFLDTKTNAPRLYRVILGLMLISIVGMALSFFARYSIIIQYTVLFVVVAPFIIAGTGIYLFIKGVKTAKYFLLAWLLLLAGLTITGLRAFGILESFFFTDYSLQIGTALEVMLLSLALADRINIMKQEKVQAQEEVIRIQKDHSESLERTVNERTQELQMERNKLVIRNRAMEEEISLARKIQEQLIPTSTPCPFIRSFYKPMELVGGDFYDFITFEDSNRIGIFISDVSGHGVPAAFITSMMKTIILQAGQKKEDPAELLLYVNDILFNQTGGNFITAFYCIYEPVHRNIIYSNAAHNPPYVIADGPISQLTGNRSVPLGIYKNLALDSHNKLYSNSRASLHPRSKLLLYTDGLTEAQPHDRDDTFFEYAHLFEVMDKNRNVSCGQFIENLYKKLVDYRGSDNFDDDVCLICLDVD